MNILLSGLLVNYFLVAGNSSSNNIGKTKLNSSRSVSIGNTIIAKVKITFVFITS